MARFTQAGGSGSGEPGPQGPAGENGNNGSDGLDSLFLGTWNSETEFLAVYQGGPVGLADGDWWAFVKDNSNPNKIYVVREDPNSATGWVIDDNESFTLPAGADGADGNNGADGAPGADGSDGEDATLPQDLGTTDSPTFSKITLTSNGAIDNITIGDDVVIGDGNVANNLVIIGNQDPTQGGIVLGNDKTEQVSSDGSNLTLEADNDIILYPGSTYAYIGTPTIGGETRIATRGYVDALGTTTSTYSPNWTGTGLAYTGTPAVGSYVKIGKLVTFHIQVTLTNVTNFGSGQYSITLPFAPIGDYAFRDGGIHAAGNHYTVMADAEAGSTTMDLWYIAGTGQDMPMDHNSPHTFTTTNKFYINGTYITD